MPGALRALDRGGTLAIAGIHLSDIPALDYQEHLFFERAICSVTANTRRDGQEFLDLAASVPVEVSTTAYPFDQADQALDDLAHDRFTGAAVIVAPRRPLSHDRRPPPASRSISVARRRNGAVSRRRAARRSSPRDGGGSGRAR